MSVPQSLQSLCTVCYAEQPKYRCPRCKTRTCSLPCYKRHQQRASCDGQRNPAEFVKKSQWATPTGIDRDYNYLKSVERNIERAEEDVKHLSGDSKPKQGRHGQAESNLQRYMQQNHITLVRAPAGMSKSRANKTRVTQSGRIYWTVAWSDAADSAFVDEDCPESSKLVDLYASAMVKRGRTALQHTTDSTNERGHKRRRVEELLHEPEPSARKAEPTSFTSTTSVNHDGNTESPVSAIQKDAITYFYLLRPGSADSKVLIPLQGQQSLTTALREQTIQEFPTIYALPYATDQLPPAFVLEADTIARQKSKPTSSGNVDKTAMPTAPAHTHQPPDAAQILEMLRRDVRSA